jgi:hypothetical protein
MHALVRPNALKRSCASTIVEGTVEGVALNYAFDAWTIDSSAKRQDIARLGVDYKMLVVDCAFYATGLIWAFEMAGDHSPLLLKVKVLRRG